MTDKEIINNLYVSLSNSSMNKDIKVLDEILSDDYVLVHMTGKNQTKEDYISSVLKGELKYYESIHESIEIKVNGESATLIGKTKTLASPFGIPKSWWNVKQEMTLKKENGNWRITKSIASSY